MADEIVAPREHRTLVIKNFRNFAPFCAGTNDDADELKEFLLLNRGLSRDDIGGLVTLVSANNCGKSNLLDALEKYNTQEFYNDDYTDFSFTVVEPYIGMNVANGAYADEYKACESIRYLGDAVHVLLAIALEEQSFDHYLEFHNSLNDGNHYVREWNDSIENDGSNIQVITKLTYIRKIASVLDSTFNSANGPVDDYFIKLVEHRKDLKFKSKDAFIKRIGNSIDDYCPDEEIEVVSKGIPIDDYFYNDLNKHNTSVDVDDLLRNQMGDNYGVMKNILSEIRTTYTDTYESDDSGMKKYEEQFGYRLSSAVRRYSRVRIKQRDLVCKPEQPNQFILNLLQILNFNKNALDNAYKGAGNLRYKLENELNKTMEALANELNDLLNINDNKYSLKIKLERENIELFVTRGDGIPLNLDRQSEGFTWLFDLYFNLIKLEKFQPGDIILLDEFGNSLSFATIKELTKKLRDYAKKNGLTFVLATQNPMAIDIHHLDEVRLLVPRDDGSTHIINNFDQFGGEGNHDIMAPILSGLTVSRNFMRTENRKTVFVEGVTDYFYLNSFCEAMGIRGKQYDVDFIPINGVGSRKGDRKEILSQIIAIERNPTIFTDGDYAGEEFYKVAKSRNVEPSNVEEILGDGKKVIEDAFSKSDAEKLGVRTSTGEYNKKFDHASILSYKIPRIYDELDDETKSNFEKIIDYVQNQ